MKPKYVFRARIKERDALQWTTVAEMPLARVLTMRNQRGMMDFRRSVYASFHGQMLEFRFDIEKP